jgi:4-amino-4-deoxy-L-arabinose transferase-like glycosyltransferase
MRRLSRAWLRRVPRAAWVCAAVACLNAVCWSVLTPPFQSPDEPDHFAYVKQLAETGHRPTSAVSSLTATPEIEDALQGLRYFEVRAQPRHHTIASQAEEAQLQVELASIHEHPAERGSRAAGTATSEPPLYYALATVPYSLSGSILTRLQLIRLLSALMAGFTALFTYLFLREALPGAPWAWCTGALAVALVPLLGFISGSVNPDSMLFAVSAALFFGLARGFRRGLTPRLAAAIGGVLAVGLMTKLNFIGLVPGAVLGLVLLTVRASRLRGRSAYRDLALACTIAAAPVAIYVVVNSLSGHPAFSIVSAGVGSRLSLHELSYIWQLFLPRLPGMGSDFPGLFTARQLWFNGYVGLYGWLDTTFPSWVYTLALLPAAAIAALCVHGVLTSTGALRPRLPEFGVYVVMSIGVLALVGASSYQSFPRLQAEFAEARYLLPMLPLLAAVLALAARGAGRRWGQTAGVLIVVLFLAHDIFSQLLVVGRFYG